MRIATPIKLTADEKKLLERAATGRRVAVRVAERAHIVLLAAEGRQNKDIAAELGISRPTVQLWRDRFAEKRMAGIEKDATRPGRKPKLSARKVRAVIKATLETTPPGETHWSTRSMAKAQNISRMAVQRIWSAHALKPHLVRTFKLSKDPRFVEKLTDVVGLYMDPPDRALVLCVDEKSQIQALDRTQPGLPLKKGRCGTMTHDYKRNGTTTLFAALNVAEGKLIGRCMPRHRHQEFIKFLRLINKETPSDLALHLIVDNYATHKHPKVKSWLKRHKRFHLHFTPTSSSWLNLVERWFREITDKRIRRGVFRSAKELVAAIEDYLAKHNANPQVFTWTAKAETILKKVRRARAVLDKMQTA